MAWARRPPSTSLTRGSITACRSASTRRSARGDRASSALRSVTCRRSAVVRSLGLSVFFGALFAAASGATGTLDFSPVRSRAWNHSVALIAGLPCGWVRARRGKSSWHHPGFLLARDLAQRFALPRQVRAHGGVGTFAVARLERRKHGQVLRQALVEPARRMQLLQARELQYLAQVADHLREPPVVRELDDRLVNDVVGGVVIVDAARLGMALQ